MNLFELARRYLRSPGHRGVQTSAQAAAKTAPRLTAAHRRIIALLTQHPAGLTADEIAQHLGWAVLFARPRVTELNKLGKIVATGEKRRNVSGMNAKVWRVDA
ncbi:MAG TPA: hypothetical protein VHM01_07395 [Alphaproteobacteria bacterium]|nr:hypothetical protein [Alphaproteobacteria bacterium]